MSPSKLNAYSGPLAPAEILDGIAAAQANALRLIGDAVLLLEQGRYPSAVALAILAIEERGKVAILKRLTLLTEPQHIRAAWREYRSHRAKNAGWIIPDLVRGGARNLRGMADAVNSDGEPAALLDNLKQIAFYTDCLGDRHWSSPSEIISQELAQSMIRMAEVMWGNREVTLRELELWGEHVQPHYGRATMIQATAAFQKAMHEEGLSDTTADQLLEFIASAPVKVA
jgi:AbiV family abortive infection protein